jgi:hypothetical protein
LQKTLKQTSEAAGGSQAWVSSQLSFPGRLLLVLGAKLRLLSFYNVHIYSYFSLRSFSLVFSYDFLIVEKWSPKRKSVERLTILKEFKLLPGFVAWWLEQFRVTVRRNDKKHY